MSGFWETVLSAAIAVVIMVIFIFAGAGAVILFSEDKNHAYIDQLCDGTGYQIQEENDEYVLYCEELRKVE